MTDNLEATQCLKMACDLQTCVHEEFVYIVPSPEHWSWASKFIETVLANRRIDVVQAAELRSYLDLCRGRTHSSLKLLVFNQEVTDLAPELVEIIVKYTGALTRYLSYKSQANTLVYI